MSSARAAKALNHWVISPASPCTLFFETELTEPGVLLGWLVSKSQGLNVSVSSVLGWKAYSIFSVDVGNQNSGLHICRRSLLLTEQSPQPLFVLFIQSWTLAHWTVPPIFKVVLPFSVKSFWKHPHWHIHRCVPSVTNLTKSSQVNNEDCSPEPIFALHYAVL